MQISGAPLTLECGQCGSDTISAIAWFDENKVQNPLVAASCWDGSVSIWEVVVNHDSNVSYIRADNANVVVHQPICVNGLVQVKLPGPALSTEFANNQTLLASCADGGVYSVQRAGGGPTALYRHEAAAVKVLVSRKHNFVASVGLDRQLLVFDLALNAVGAKLALSGVPVAAALNTDHIVVLLSNADLLVFAVKELGAAPKVISSQEFGMPPVCLALQQNGTYVGIGSSEGRGRCLCIAGVRNPFYFRAHRLTDTGSLATTQTATDKTYCHMINTCDFHDATGVYATGGGDGYIHTWNFITRQRLTSLEKQLYAVTALKFAPNHGLFAYAIGDDYAKGANGKLMCAPKLFVRVVDESMFMGRKKL